MSRQRVQDLLLLALMAPVVVVLGAIIAIAVFLDSPGPIFYRSVRVGRGGSNRRKKSRARAVQSYQPSSFAAIVSAVSDSTTS